MNNKLLGCLVAGVLLAAASPASAFHGGGGGMHMGGGGMHMGGMHFGGMHFGGTHFGGMHFGGGPHFAGFAGPHFGQFAHHGFSPRFSRFAFRDRGFFHHRFHHFRHFRSFAFVGAPFLYASYDSCWRRVWTPYGRRWVDVCTSYYDY